MVVLDLLYKLLIGPLELFFEVLFSVAYRFLGDVSLSIIFLSLAMNLLVLPLYRRADALQEEERDRANAMKHWSDHIKKTFKGDERFMMQQTYNRQMGYKPTDVFKGSLSLLLEIPFFIAAFHFLSNLQLMKGVSLGPITDLGAPDALLQFGDISVNILPILMTAINIVSAAIYLKGFPTSSKIQTYGIAAIFLVLLYNSPAGLVFYWTLNNLFSLAKNVFYKLNDPKRAVAYTASLAGFALIALCVFMHVELSALRIAAIGGIFLICQVPLLLRILGSSRTPKLKVHEATPTDDRAFTVGCLFLAVVTGLLIPLTVIQTSPAEFVSTTHYQSPLWLVAESFALALGTFVIWFGVFYRLATPKGKTIFGIGIFFFAVAAVVDYLFFGNDYGTLSPLLQYTGTLEVSRQSIFVNLGLLALVAAVLAVIWHRKRSIVPVAYTCMTIAVVAMSAMNAFSIETTLVPTREAIENSAGEEQALPSIPLSKDGKNVVVIMLDRAIPNFVPIFVNEKPELKAAYDGFTLYRNTISYGPVTNIGSPAIYGGSEYRPSRMNERSDLSLADKHNESLRIMPTLLSKEGFDNTILDPTYAGYRWIPDLTLFDDIPNTTAAITMDGSFVDESALTDDEVRRKRAEQARNLFCYSVFRCSPTLLHNILYQHGGYNSTAPLSQISRSGSESMGIDPTFMESYSVLERMPEISKVSDGAQNNFLMMSNNTTHEATVLKEPEYTPEPYVNNIEYDREHAVRTSETGEELHFDEGEPGHRTSLATHYESNMAAILSLGRWFDYLREQGVYDNTRIIIVSDHAWEDLIDDKLYVNVDGQYSKGAEHVDLRAFNCMLMVKDFDAHGFTVSDEFMTNADVPVFALKGIVDNPTNPYTGAPIDESYKQEGAQEVLYSLDFDILENNGTAFSPGYWYSVEDNALSPDNWNYLGVR